MPAHRPPARHRRSARRAATTPSSISRARRPASSRAGHCVQSAVALHCGQPIRVAVARSCLYIMTTADSAKSEAVQDCSGSRAALLPEGWADERPRRRSRDGRFASVAAGAAPQPGDERARRRASRASPTCTATPSSAAWPASPKRAAPTSDSFWTWREAMYRFVDAHDAGRRSRPSPRWPMSRCWRPASPASASSTTSTTTPTARAYANRAEMADRIAAAAEATGIGLTLLPVFYAHGDFGGAPPSPGQARFLQRSRSVSQTARGAAAPPSPASTAAGRRCAALACAPSRRTNSRRRRARAGRPDPHPRRRAGEGGRGLPRLDAARGRSNGCSTNAGVDRALVPDPRHPHDRRRKRDGLAPSGAVAGLCPVTEANLGDGIFPARRFLVPGRCAAASARDSNVRIDASARSCDASSRRSGCVDRARNLLAAPPRLDRRAGCSLARGGRRRGARLGTAGGSPSGRPPIWWRSTRRHPALSA